MTRRSMMALLALTGLGCGGLFQGAQDAVEEAAEKVEERVADEVERGVAKGLGVPASEVDIRREGDTWSVDLPHGEGDCKLGPQATGTGLPVAMAAPMARCDVTVDVKELTGHDVPALVGNRFDVAARRLTGSPKAVLAERRKELQAKGWTVHEVSDNGMTLLAGLDGQRPEVAVAVGDAGAGAMEFVAVPMDIDKKKGKGKRRRKR